MEGEEKIFFDHKSAQAFNLANTKYTTSISKVRKWFKSTCLLHWQG